MSTTPVAAPRPPTSTGALPPCATASTARSSSRVTGFAEAALAWSGRGAHPAAIVVAEDVGDVIAAVTFAAELGLGLGVQATGHGVALRSTACCS